jgi:hypothetical protein
MTLGSFEENALNISETYIVVYRVMFSPTVLPGAQYAHGVPNVSHSVLIALNAVR